MEPRRRSIVQIFNSHVAAAAEARFKASHFAGGGIFHAKYILSAQNPASNWDLGARNQAHDVVIADGVVFFADAFAPFRGVRAS